ncbi:DUF1328 domain-containing protein [Mesonia mobilis]|uniref:DUF1328 domain-containing protein n=1 Tax=Mesonia mobilis TaxID=369791 RepID=A0ABQ3BI70_9FLAO|nr:DUF1328 domain-containing protein [Mesonia mobilis]MBQ0738493.1 DUF1328 domain-containing protein [Aquimarina celericrescens]GGZ46507.1 hypothetical protein GCM10008088_04940 [Mesonia mobilis]
MKEKSITFLVLALVTGVLGFALGNFTGSQILRVLFIVFADLFVVSILAKGLFSNSTQLKKVKVRK